MTQLYRLAWKWRAPIDPSEYRYYLNSAAPSEETFFSAVKTSLVELAEEWLADPEKFSADYELADYLMQDGFSVTAWYSATKVNPLDVKMKERGYTVPTICAATLPDSTPASPILEDGTVWRKDIEKQWAELLGTELHTRLYEKNKTFEVPSR